MATKKTEQLKQQVIKYRQQSEFAPKPEGQQTCPVIFPFALEETKSAGFPQEILPTPSHILTNLPMHFQAKNDVSSDKTIAEQYCNHELEKRSRPN